MNWQVVSMSAVTIAAMCSLPPLFGVGLVWYVSFYEYSSSPMYLAVLCGLGLAYLPVLAVLVPATMVNGVSQEHRLLFYSSLLLAASPIPAISIFTFAAFMSRCDLWTPRAVVLTILSVWLAGAWLVAGVTGLWYFGLEVQNSMAYLFACSPTLILPGQAAILLNLHTLYGQEKRPNSHA